LQCELAPDFRVKRIGIKVKELWMFLIPAPRPFKKPEAPSWRAPRYGAATSAAVPSSGIGVKGLRVQGLVFRV
jgi:hypothetical protein